MGKGKSSIESFAIYIQYGSHDTQWFHVCFIVTIWPVRYSDDLASGREACSAHTGLLEVGNRRLLRECQIMNIKSRSEGGGRTADIVAGDWFSQAPRRTTYMGVFTCWIEPFGIEGRASQGGRRSWATGRSASSGQQHVPWRAITGKDQYAISRPDMRLASNRKHGPHEAGDG